ncbi:hypothetical protein O6H91_13G106100 [Diphasiastrum complanatum]|uniref:Uncharacterized protein n=1 Tax=Diphasiastrum complanatum TaxID=34168 RepID=A0ACC2BY59_DIPCM|nr:hypothetical protein O6H91_13G106100 [Diphasiastrum complanatum]
MHVQISEMLCKELGGHAKVYIWDGRGPNPHLGHLAWGDAFVLTADSVSMLSESCSTGKPVYVIGGERCTWKIGDFHRTLRQRGLIRSFTGAEDFGMLLFLQMRVVARSFQQGIFISDNRMLIIMWNLTPLKGVIRRCQPSLAA